MLEEPGEPSTFGVVDMPTVQIKRGKRIVNHVSATFLAQALSDLPYTPTVAFMESVHSMPGQSSFSMFAFGRGVGVLEGVLAGRQIGVSFVTPQAWQKKMGIQGETKSSSRERAGQLLPSYADLFKRVKDDGRADAALILLWGLKVMEEL